MILFPTPLIGELVRWALTLAGVALLLYGFARERREHPGPAVDLRRRFVLAFLVALACSAVLRAEILIPDGCREDYWRAICGDWWWWCAAATGCLL